MLTRCIVLSRTLGDCSWTVMLLVIDEQQYQAHDGKGFLCSSSLILESDSRSLCAMSVGGTNGEPISLILHDDRSILSFIYHLR